MLKAQARASLLVALAALFLAAPALANRESDALRARANTELFNLDQADALTTFRQLGAAVGLRASYAASVEGSLASAFRSAREAYDEHERVLELDPKRRDAGLIVGTYRYVVSTLAFPLRWMAYVVGLGGGKEKGLE